MERHSDRMRRKDTTKGPPLRVLSLDGGGVRGYSMLILLQELMYKTFNEAEGKPPKPNEIPKPCDYFDLIVGSGTGGLIALMLGRLRLDVETCKEVYIRMTRRVFETDKTIAGIPYRSTLFKASKLQEAIQDCVREHTIFVDEGNDGTAMGGVEMPVTPGGGVFSPISGVQRRTSHASSVRSSGANTTTGGFTPMSPGVGAGFARNRWGNPNASLYDNRENRTKTAVTAVYEGTPKNGKSVLLRSYDSRAEGPPEFNCSIWEAGRATSAIGLAFKPIQIGQSKFHDDGAGNFNPTPQVVDECLAEYPNREIGVLVSIGTGKRPGGSEHQQAEWWEGFIGGSMGSFAEARRRLIQKIEACEDTHRFVKDIYLKESGVNPDHYYRLNVEVGVGEFGMNEWSRLAEISTNTRMYLSRPETRAINEAAAKQLGRIERMKKRVPLTNFPSDEDYEKQYEQVMGKSPYPPMNNAVELPGDEGAAFENPPPGSRGKPHYRANAEPTDKFSIMPEDALSPSDAMSPQQRRKVGSGGGDSIPGRLSGEGESDSSIQPSPRRSYERRQQDQQRRDDAAFSAPPLPPKTPLGHATTLPNPQHYVPPPYRHQQQPQQQPAPQQQKTQLPYPVYDDEPPPQVDMGRKPTLQR